MMCVFDNYSITGVIQLVWVDQSLSILYNLEFSLNSHLITLDPSDIMSITDARPGFTKHTWK
jgi:hypothetical protein